MRNEDFSTYYPMKITLTPNEMRRLKEPFHPTFLCFQRKDLDHPDPKNDIYFIEVHLTRLHWSNHHFLDFESPRFKESHPLLEHPNFAFLDETGVPPSLKAEVEAFLEAHHDLVASYALAVRFRSAADAILSRYPDPKAQPSDEDSKKLTYLFGMSIDYAAYYQREYRAYRKSLQKKD